MAGLGSWTAKFELTHGATRYKSWGAGLGYGSELTLDLSPESSQSSHFRFTMKAFFAAIVAAAVTSVTAHCTCPLPRRTPR